jgi:hypothetical protein
MEENEKDKFDYSLASIDNKGTVNSFSTNELPKVKANNAERELEVVLSSVVSEDKKLLNQMLAKTQSLIDKPSKKNKK